MVNSSSSPELSKASMESAAMNSVERFVQRWSGNEPSIRVKVESRVGQKGETYISVSRFATIDALLGLCAGHFKLEVNGTVALYSSDGRLLYGTKKVKDLIKTEDTIYLQRKQRGDECLFRTNWCYWGTFFLLVSMCGVLCLTCIYTLTGQNAPFKYGVVVDAGSSHSTAHLFHWDPSKANGTGRAIEDKGVPMEGGIHLLSPNETYRRFTDAFEIMKTRLPSNILPESVPVYLVATAGMRMLTLADPVRAYAVLCAAGAAIRDRGFTLKKAEISDGIDEGIDDWVSLNYNSKHLPLRTPTLGALDLGGGSLEVAVQVSNESHATRNLTLFGTDYHVFGQTSLCFGSDQAYYRYVMMLLLNNHAFDKPALELVSPCHCNGYIGSLPLSTVLGPCAQNPRIPKNIADFKDQNITITGKWDPAECQSLANDVVDVVTCHKNGFSYCFDDLTEPLPMDQGYVAFSAYYFTINETQSTPRSPSDLSKTAGSFCKPLYKNWLDTYYQGSRKRSEYGCWKINYVDRIFSRKYNFTEEGFKNVQFKRDTESGDEISWPLGYMLAATNSIPVGNPKPPVLTTVPYILLMVVCMIMLIVAFVMFRCHHNADLRKVQGLMFASSISAV